MSGERPRAFSEQPYAGFYYPEKPLTLAGHLERLLHWLKEIGLTPPSEDVRVVEINDATERFPESSIGPWYRIRQDELRNPADYEARFDELLKAGYQWLNLSCYGIYKGLLIAAIEVPSITPFRKLHPGCLTSINLSGPCNGVLDRQWDAGAVLDVE